MRLQISTANIIRANIIQISSVSTANIIRANIIQISSVSTANIIRANIDCKYHPYMRLQISSVRR